MAVGFVIAFALWDSPSNLTSGIMILFFRPFDVGDTVDAGGASGKVTTMNLVSTSIKTFDTNEGCSRTLSVTWVRPRERALSTSPIG